MKTLNWKKFSEIQSHKMSCLCPSKKWKEVWEVRTCIEERKYELKFEATDSIQFLNTGTRTHTAINAIVAVIKNNFIQKQNKTNQRYS